MSENIKNIIIVIINIVHLETTCKMFWEDSLLLFSGRLEGVTKAVGYSLEQ